MCLMRTMPPMPGNGPRWLGWESNPQPAQLECAALPIELPGLVGVRGFEPPNRPKPHPQVLYTRTPFSASGNSAQSFLAIGTGANATAVTVLP